MTAALEVIAALGPAIVQDGGRPGRMHQGIPPGGALVPELMGRANGAVGNTPAEAAVEVFGALTVRALAEARVATDDGAVRTLAAGDTLTVASGTARVAYLAIRGGLDVPIVLGGRGTLVAAGLGGLEGRPLRKGDVLRAHAGVARGASARPVGALPGADAPVAVVLGPDRDRFDEVAVERLFQATFRVSARSDRMGVRLEGPSLPRLGDDLGTSAPMIAGAIQVPGSGDPIVLGPDHPTTGGYPVIATVVRSDLGGLMARPVGAPIRFTRAELRKASG